jgi:hypothetical protein
VSIIINGNVIDPVMWWRILYIIQGRYPGMVRSRVVIGHDKSLVRKSISRDRKVKVVQADSSKIRRAAQLR